MHGTQSQTANNRHWIWHVRDPQRASHPRCWIKHPLWLVHDCMRIACSGTHGVHGIYPGVSPVYGLNLGLARAGTTSSGSGMQEGPGLPPHGASTRGLDGMGCIFNTSDLGSVGWDQHSPSPSGKIVIVLSSGLTWPILHALRLTCRLCNAG